MVGLAPTNRLPRQILGLRTLTSSSAPDMALPAIPLWFPLHAGRSLVVAVLGHLLAEVHQRLLGEAVLLRQLGVHFEPALGDATQHVRGG